MHKRTRTNFTVFRITILSLLLFNSCYIELFAWSNIGYAHPEQDTTPYYQEVSELIALSDSLALLSPMKALEYGVKAIYLAEQAPIDTNNLVKALNQGGVAAFYAGYIGEATNYFTRELGLLDLNKPSEQLANIYNNLGGVYQYGKNEMDSAILYNKRAIEVIQKLAQTDTSKTYYLHLSHAYSNVGTIYLDHNDYSNAEYHFDLCLQLPLDTSVYQRGLITSQLGLARVYLNTNRKEHAFQIIEASEQYCQKWKDFTLMPAVDYIKGQWYEQAGNTANAIQYYQKALQKVNTENTHTSINEIARALSELYQKEGQEEEALKHLQMALSAEEKIDKQQSSQDLTKMEMQLQLKKWKREIEQEVQKKQKQYLWLITFIGSLALFSTTLLLLGQKQKRRSRLLYLESQIQQEQMALEKEKLLQSVEEIEQQLAVKLIERMARNELIEATIQKLLQLYRMPKFSSRSPLQELANSLRDVQDYSIWEEFELLYSKSHSDFFQNLNGIEGLTSNDRRLCILLHMNMTSKEISALTGQSVKAVEVARTRLRKKLGLTNTNMGLTEFLAKL
ncbi:tetratricopeptide repeat protein [Phaeodactylibacter xiamenensis]|uniref:tetratricopeptide repeat protein n=1 Tax=Phaeodactylibacter xiamenensis TaxID=1524460 RepID=UPI0024A80A64|nr:hypothetical protein [Phaeodactylibacter xiamenensis]